jgi:hypothetical protein
VGVATKFTFGNKPSKKSYKEKHYHKPWFDAKCCTTKHEVRLWLTTNLDLHVAKHQENEL